MSGTVETAAPTGQLAPRQLSTLEQKLALMERLGLSAVVVQPFDRAFAAVEPEAFEALLLDQLQVGEVVVGFDYTYGKARGGTVETLRAACEARGAAFSVVPKVTVDGLPASSTKVRELLLDGKVAPASRLLDRHYALEGEVVRGAASVDGALASCNVIGGTAPTKVAEALAAARRRLGLAAR